MVKGRKFSVSVKILGKKSEKSAGKYKEYLKIAIEGTEHTVRTTDNGILHRKTTPTPIKLQKSPKRDMSPNKHKQKGQDGKCASISEEAQKLEENGIFESKTKVHKIQ